MSYIKALEIITEELKQESFGVLTEIEVKAILDKKLNVQFSPYRISDTGYTPSVNHALEYKEHNGTSLQSIVTIQEAADGETRTGHPGQEPSIFTMNILNLKEIGEQILKILKSVIDKLNKVILNI